MPDQLASNAKRSPSVTANKTRRAKQLIGATLSLLILAVALGFLHRELAGLSASEIADQIDSIPFSSVFAAVLFTVCSYLILTGYDTAAVRYIGQTLAFRHTATTAFMAYAVGHNVGIAALSGGTVRYRMYSALGLSNSQIARIVLFTTFTFFLGASLLIGVSVMLMPENQIKILHMPPLAVQTGALTFFSLPLIYLIVVSVRRRPLKLGNWQLDIPTPGLGLTQIGLAVADLMCASATLYVLLAADLTMGYVPFLGIYLIAILAGLISSIPAGIGVFEAVLLAALPSVDPTALVGTVVVYRLIYYVAPLCIALVLLVVNELKVHRILLEDSTRGAINWLSSVTPAALATAVFLGGVVLLISGSTPALESRLNFIAKAIPLSVLELSHLSGSLFGLALLILARGLYRRLHGAYFASVAILSGGILVSLLKGFDYEEAFILLVILTILWFSRSEFYRQGTVSSQHFSVVWIASIVLVLLVAYWTALASVWHVEYRQQLWWQFALHADVSRILRAGLVTAIATTTVVLWKVLRTGVPLDAGSSPPELALVRDILSRTDDSSANVALLGDKRFLWSEDQRAFIMYRLSGNSWIALGDPVGPEEASDELLWKFRELVDRYDGRPVFYEITDRYLPSFVNMGLSLAKIGEDARVPLNDFTLQGSHRSSLRQTVNRALREGAVFDVVPSSGVAAILPELRGVSEDWLKDKSSSEKGFSLGAFSPQYLCNFDCAIVRLKGNIVAFANIWHGSAGGEISIDLMRYNRSAPKGIMDFLFCELMLWAKTQGYTSFSLGMAPLSGLEQRPLAPLWHKMGHLIFKHGESFYNFEGLRHYKEKFDPQWQPRYIACQGGVFSLPRALLDTSRLIAGGVSKIIPR